MSKKHHHQNKNQAKQEIKEDIAEQSQKSETISETDAPNNELENKITELEEKLLRNIAEMENLRKRTAKELEDARKYSITSIVKDLLETVENMHRALESIEGSKLNNDIVKSIYEGVEMTKNSMMNTLNKHGVKRINPLGEEFNHDQHQAIGQIESEEYKPGTIAQVVQAGYILDDRLLRPALVMVAK